MAKAEAQLDMWVMKQLNEADIEPTAQGSTIKAIDEALSVASKHGTGKPGYPEFVAKVKEFVIVIEDKASTKYEVKYDDEGLLDLEAGGKGVIDYAVNGAVYYARFIAMNTPFNKVFAIGVSGDERHHRIKPYFVNERGYARELEELESFINFSEQNIKDYYTKSVCNNPTEFEKSTQAILKDASELHEYLRAYGALADQDKPLVVAGILLALSEIEDGEFSLKSLQGKQEVDLRDGDKIYEAIRKRLGATHVAPPEKKDRLLHQFELIPDSERLNEVNEALGMTPLKFYAEFLYRRIYSSMNYKETSEDFIGRFYGEFMRYSGGDGQPLGIVLTPRHICDLMCELVDVRSDDIVFDPCCGTGGFLIAAMYRMLRNVSSEYDKNNIKRNQIHGVEIKRKMFAIAVANMILRDDGKANIDCADFLKQNPAEYKRKGVTVGLMNPPYSQGKVKDPNQFEISFVDRLLKSCTRGGRAAVIVPQSSMTGKSREEKNFKKEILKRNTLEGVITCNTNTFYGVGTNPVIAVFTCGIPHEKDHVVKFIDFRNDGYEVTKHVGLVEGDTAKDKRTHLLDVWRGRIEAESSFCINTTVTADDEWLHSFFYFDDTVPVDDAFEKTVGDYLSFQMSMVMQGRSYLFDGGDTDE